MGRKPMSEWARKLTRRQLEVIKQDTLENEEKHPYQPQEHIHRDIASEVEKRDLIKGANR